MSREDAEWPPGRRPQLLSVFWGFLCKLRKWPSLGLHIITVLFRNQLSPKLVHWLSPLPPQRTSTADAEGTKVSWVSKNRQNQKHHSRIRNRDTWGELKRADIKKAGVATAHGLANLRFAESKIGRQPQRHRIIVITIVFFLYNMHKE